MMTMPKPQDPVAVVANVGAIDESFVDVDEHGYAIYAEPAEPDDPTEAGGPGPAAPPTSPAMGAGESDPPPDTAMLPAIAEDQIRAAVRGIIRDSRQKIEEAKAAAAERSTMPLADGQVSLVAVDNRENSKDKLRDARDAEASITISLVK